MADSILLIQREERERDYDSLLPSCPVSQYSCHLPQQSHTTLKVKLKHTHAYMQPAPVRLGGCVMDRGLAYPHAASCGYFVSSLLEPEQKAV